MIAASLISQQIYVHYQYYMLSDVESNLPLYTHIN